MKKVISAVLCLVMLVLAFLSYAYADDYDDNLIFLGRYEQDNED